MPVEKADVKELVKESLVDLLLEEGGDVQRLLLEALEDAALVKAMDEGRDSPLVDRDEVMKWIQDHK